MLLVLVFLIIGTQRDTGEHEALRIGNLGGQFLIFGSGRTDCFRQHTVLLRQSGILLHLFLILDIQIIKAYQQLFAIVL